MHICLAMPNKGADWMGGVIYTQNLARAIASLPTEEKKNLQLSIVGDPESLSLMEQTHPYIECVSVKEQIYLKFGKKLSEYLPFLPSKLFNFLQINFMFPTAVGKRSPYVWGGWIPDFQHRYMPELFTEEEVKFRDRHHQKIAQTAPVIILSSQMAHADFIGLYPDTAKRSRLLSFASFAEPQWFEQDPLLTQKKYQLPNRFFLISNQFWPHKNHSIVIEALAILKQEKIYPVVVCTGKKLISTAHPHYNQQVQYYEKFSSSLKELELEKQVKILGLIPRTEQIQLMRRCLAVIQPSLFEGWSTVVEDARSLGKNILLSDFPVHLEQNPPYSSFFKRNDSEELATLIKQAWLSLEPGPHFVKEEIARKENQAINMEFGRNFLKIAGELVNT